MHRGDSSSRSRAVCRVETAIVAGVISSASQVKLCEVKPSKAWGIKQLHWLHWPKGKQMQDAHVHYLLMPTNDLDLCLPLFCVPASISHHLLAYKTLRMDLTFQTSPVWGRGREREGMLMVINMSAQPPRTTV